MSGAEDAYRSARDIASPYWYSVQSGIIGELELAAGSPCDAASDIALGLDGRGREGPHIVGPDRERLSASLTIALARC